ncbi:MAG: methyltransferase domain-containing protein [Armatimonadetes bacterium]|nr:methyltransferase domain-containing protein [Armatimonadota bacterium]
MASKDLQLKLVERTVRVGGEEYRIEMVDDIDSLLAQLPQDAELPYWAILWESAVALGEQMAERPELVQSQSVLELGAGLGLCGMVAARLGGVVTQTDSAPSALEMCRSNAVRNGIEGIRVLQEDWRAWRLTELFDVVIASDVAYERALHEPLMSAVEASLAPWGVALFADPWRDSGWEFADKLLKGGWKLGLQSRKVCPTGDEVEVTLIEARRGEI